MKTLASHIDELRAAIAESEGKAIGSPTGMREMLSAQLTPSRLALDAFLSCRRERFEGENVAFDFDGRTVVSQCYRTIDGFSVVSIDGVPHVIETDKLRSWRPTHGE